MVHTNNSIITTHFSQNTILLLMYDGSTRASVYGSSSGATSTSAQSIVGVWRVMNQREDGNTYTSAYCSTGATTAAKTATCSGYIINSNQKHYIHIVITSTNTTQSALTLNINGQGAKPIYINGTASSSTNYNLTRGSYLAYYDGTNYHFRTDGKLQGSLAGNADTATKATQDGSGNVITSTYLKLSGGTLTGNLQIGNSDSTTTTADAIGITVRDLRAVEMAPSTLGDRTAAFYFDTAGPSNDNGWKSILRVKGWTGSYGAWELAGPASDSDTKEFYVRSGLGGSSWGAWRKLLTSSNYTNYTVKKDGTGASGTWGISINGNAATASLVKVILNDDSNWRAAVQWRNTTLEAGTYLSHIGRHNTGGNSNYPGSISIVPYATDTSPWSGDIGLFITKDAIKFEGTKFIDSAGKVYGAVWNDYVEFRESNEQIQSGRVVIENGDDTLSLSNERLQPGANIVSDTYGFAIGKTSRAQTPIAVSGRVLAYPYESRDTFSAGDAVCSGPNGTVSKMTREEIIMYPERIIGTVSAIPDYEIWGTGNILVNGRIWITIK